jgi:hypothetical protein
MVAYSDTFYYGGRWLFQYTVPDSVDCVNYTLRQGCSSDALCSGSVVITFQPGCSAGSYFDGSGCAAAAAGFYAPTGTSGVFYRCPHSVLAGAANCDAPLDSGCLAGQYYFGGGCSDVPYGYYNPTAGANILYYCSTPATSTGATSCPVTLHDNTDEDDSPMLRDRYKIR